jgi:hypothetical protein
MPLNIKPCKQECNAQFNSGNAGLKFARRTKCKKACKVKLTETEHDSILDTHKNKDGLIEISDLKEDIRKEVVKKCKTKNTNLWSNLNKRNKSKIACEKITFE